MTVPAKPSFSDYYPLETFAALQAHLQKVPEHSSTELAGWRKQYSDLSDLLGAAALSYLEVLRGLGQLSPIGFAEERGHRFGGAWNRFLDGSTEAWDRNTLMNAFSGSVDWRMSARSLANPSHETLYGEVVQLVDAGTFEWFEAKGMESDCVVTGERLYVEFQGWRGQLGKVDHKARTGFIPITEPLPPKQVSHHVIQAPSGELLVADWFRIEAFTKFVKSDKHHDINCAAGRQAETAHHANQHGFMSVMVGNTSPSIVQRGGHFIVASLDEDSGETAGKHLGRVCTDLWWATAIDRQILVELVAKGSSVSSEEAQALVQAEIEPRDFDVTVVKVPKGALHVYHTATPTDMSLFECDEVDVGHLHQLYAVVSDHELAWRPKGQAKPEAAPARRNRPR